MKLYWSPRSPFVRKVMIFAHECGLASRIECERTLVAMNKPNLGLLQINPTGKIPTLLLDDGAALYDSTVICEYLDSLHGGRPLLPPSGAARWTALRRHALGNNLTDNLMLWPAMPVLPTSCITSAGTTSSVWGVLTNCHL